VIATLRDFMKQYQSRLLRPFNSPTSHAGNVQPVAQAQEQPIPGLVTDPVLSQSNAEFRFESAQVASGFQVIQSGMVDTAADEANLRVFQEQGQLPGVPEVPDPFGWNSQQGYPELQQQSGDAPEPMPHPGMFGLGGW